MVAKRAPRANATALRWYRLACEYDECAGGAGKAEIPDMIKYCLAGCDEQSRKNMLDLFM